MKKAIFTITLLVGIMMSMPSEARHYDPRWGANHNPASPYYGAHKWGNPYRHYRRYSGKKYRTSDLAIAGGIAYILGRMSVAPIQHRPDTKIIYAQPRRRSHRQVCTIREVYNSSGILIRKERVCR